MTPSAFLLPPSDLAQQELPLSGAAEDALRQVFEASSLRARGYTFERAMRIPHFKRCLERSAQALLRRNSAADSRFTIPDSRT